MDLKKILDEAITKGQGFVLTIGTDAKETCTDARDLLRARNELNDAYFELGKAIFGYCKENPKLKVTKDFAAELDGIADLIAMEEKLSERLEERFSKKAPVCTGCGAELKKSDVFCSKCGKPVPKEVEPEIEDDFVCPGCGADVKEDDVFCSKCGFELPS